MEKIVAVEVREQSANVTRPTPSPSHINQLDQRAFKIGLIFFKENCCILIQYNLNSNMSRVKIITLSSQTKDDV